MVFMVRVKDRLGLEEEERGLAKKRFVATEEWAAAAA